MPTPVDVVNIQPMAENDRGAPASRVPTMSLRGAVFLGIGAMVGAGIFALLGEAGAVAGSALWLSFLVAGLISLALGYAMMIGLKALRNSVASISSAICSNRPLRTASVTGSSIATLSRVALSRSGGRAPVAAR